MLGKIPNENKILTTSKSSLVLVLLAATGIIAAYGLMSNQLRSRLKPSKNLTLSSPKVTLIENYDLKESETNSLEVTNFVAGETVTADYVFLQQSGFVVVHKETDGLPGSVIGTSRLLAEGESTPVLITLTRSVAVNDILFVRLYLDDGDNIFDLQSDRAALDDQGNEIFIRSAVGGESVESPTL